MSQKIRRKKLHNNKPWDDLYRELTGESERAAAIVGGAMIDEALTRLLASFLVEDQVEIDDLFDKHLNSLDARITLCYCLGLITKEEKGALTAIRKIRNHFAHQLHDASFTDQPVRDHSQRLESYGRFITHLSDPSPRDYFQAAVGALVHALTLRPYSIVRRRRAVSPTIQELLEGITVVSPVPLSEIVSSDDTEKEVDLD